MFLRALYRTAYMRRLFYIFIFSRFFLPTLNRTAYMCRLFILHAPTVYLFNFNFYFFRAPCVHQRGWHAPEREHINKGRRREHINKRRRRRHIHTCASTALIGVAASRVRGWVRGWVRARPRRLLKFSKVSICVVDEFVDEFVRARLLKLAEILKSHYIYIYVYMYIYIYIYTHTHIYMYMYIYR